MRKTLLGVSILSACMLAGCGQKELASDIGSVHDVITTEASSMEETATEEPHEEFHQEVQEVVIDETSVSGAKDYFTLNEIPVSKDGKFTLTVDDDRKLEGNIEVKLVKSKSSDKRTLSAVVTVPLDEYLKKDSIDVTQWFNLGFIDRFTGACVMLNGEKDVYAELIPQGVPTEFNISSERIMNDDSYVMSVIVEYEGDYSFGAFMLNGADEKVNEGISYNNFVNDIDHIYLSGSDTVTEKYPITYYVAE